MTNPPQPIRREQYRPPDWLVPEIGLDFSLDPQATRVRSTLVVERNGSHDRPLRLDGDGLALLALRVDGAETGWTMDGPTLVIELDAKRAIVETEVEIAPAANSKLMGLYSSSGLLCTQCEAEGFRRISFFPDRPDVLSRYSVRMEADEARFPVLLANGNPVASGKAEGGRHWARWDDPFPKPCYLFAMVAGDLAANRDQFTTMSGRQVELAIWVKAADLPRTCHAMDSLKAAMAWDERVYGREYDLARFNIVAVDDFNFGAMENKGLNIFNSRYILADTETASDADFDAIAAVVAHEYFHNWSGNRVTLRDWFQLSLKEGLTVFRDQQFSADTGSAAVERIDQVRTLRAAQFPEDAGPLAHPVRPESYLEISNFYTATIYNKGAELIRMLHTILGPRKFRAGTDLYFSRNDGKAVTCEDFVAALEDASAVDLRQFRLWYSQAGTPRVAARLEHDGATSTAILTLGQHVPPTPGQPVKQAMVIPLRLALIGADSGRGLGGGERLVLLDGEQVELRFTDVGEQPLLSINRGFSAPVIIEAERAPGEIERLATSDSDPFARFEAIQELMLRQLLAAIGGAEPSPAALIEAIGATLGSTELDPAFMAEAILLPSEALLAERIERVDPDAIHLGRDRLQAQVSTALRDRLEAAYSGALADPESRTAAAKGKRRLRAATLSYLAAGDPQRGASLAADQFAKSRTMTERQSALAVLARLGGAEWERALTDFYRRFAGDPLVVDKWFAVQASAPRADTVERVEELIRHSDFTIANPNRLRSVVGSFAASPFAFHRSDGAGYRLLARMVVEADAINPQTAARFVPPLGRWNKYDATRSAMMRDALQHILAAPGLSKDVFELASKSLG